jgi:hypothetical protein
MPYPVIEAPSEQLSLDCIAGCLCQISDRAEDELDFTAFIKDKAKKLFVPERLTSDIVDEIKGCCDENPDN